MRTPTNLRYVAEPKHVREVSLIGTTDFRFWSHYLEAEGLVPVRHGDAAQVVMVAAEMVYLGNRFTEVSFSVRVLLAEDLSRSGMRLLHAFTSSRVFAWCERTLFGTPYSHGDCEVSIHRPVSVRVGAAGGFVFRAEMSPLARQATSAGDQTWEGPVFLPPRSAACSGRLFFGRLKGHTVAHPFLSDDMIAFDGSAGGGVLRLLVDSGFSGKEWAVRADATHAKSRSYRRTDVFGP